MINKHPKHNPVVSKYDYRFLTCLLDISAFITYAHEYADRKGKLELTDREMGFIVKVRDFYELLLRAYQKLDVEKTGEFFEDSEAMFTKEDDITEILGDKNHVIAHYFLWILKEFSDIGNIILILKLEEEKEKAEKKK